MSQCFLPVSIKALLTGKYGVTTQHKRCSWNERKSRMIFSSLGGSNPLQIYISGIMYPRRYIPTIHSEEPCHRDDSCLLEHARLANASWMLAEHAEWQYERSFCSPRSSI
jgi:hypothetical protein